MKCFNLLSVHGRGDGASLHRAVTHEPSLRVIYWSDCFILTVHLPAGDPRCRPTAPRLSDWSPPHNKANHTAAIFHQSVNYRCGWVTLFFFVKQSGRPSLVEGASPTLLRNKRLRALESFSWLELMVWQSIMCWRGLRSLVLFKPVIWEMQGCHWGNHFTVFVPWKHSKMALFTKSSIQPIKYSLILL